MINRRFERNEMFVEAIQQMEQQCNDLYNPRTLLMIANPQQKTTVEVTL